MLPQRAHMPYLGPAHPLQGATLETDFSDLAKNGLGEKWSFDLHEPQIWDSGADIVVLVSAHIDLYHAIVWAGTPQPSMSESQKIDFPAFFMGIFGVFGVFLKPGYYQYGVVGASIGRYRL